MVFRLVGVLLAGETQPRQVIAQHGQRFFHQIAGEIPGTVGHQFTAPQADEQGMELVIQLLA